MATATGEEGSGSAAADLGREAVAMATEEEGSGSACHVARTPNSKNEIENYSLNNIASKSSQTQTTCRQTRLYVRLSTSVDTRTYTNVCSIKMEHRGTVGVAVPTGLEVRVHDCGNETYQSSSRIVAESCTVPGSCTS